MEDYISRQAAIDELCYVDEYNSRSIATIRAMKPADVRPVVYCKDCDEAKRNTVDGAIYCSVWDYWEMPEKGFCHYGSSIMKDGD